MSNTEAPKRVLNVGGNNLETHPMPTHYKHFIKEVLDIDPRVKPNIVADARELLQHPTGNYDAIFCSHNLEHYYPHEVPRVLKGFQHMLAADGYAEIWVPDVGWVMREMIQKNMDIDDVLYTSPAGPIMVRDVLYGWHKEIEESGQDYYAHKTGFTPKSLAKNIVAAGFPYYALVNRKLPYEVGILAFKQQPNAFQIKLLSLDKVTEQARQQDQARQKAAS